MALCERTGILARSRSGEQETHDGADEEESAVLKELQIRSPLLTTGAIYNIECAMAEFFE